MSYLTLGLRDNDPANQKTVLQLPIIGEPEIYNGVHRHKIIRIEYTEGGGYTTIGSDGLMKYWNLNWGHIRTEETSPSKY